MKRVAIILLLVIGLAACASTQEQYDLYVDAQSSRATANAADAKAQFQERYLTATADAPLVHITETAAALSVASTQAVIDRTATAFAWTPTNSPTPTPNMTATVDAALAIANQTQIANQIARDNLQLEREQIMNKFWAVLAGLVFVFAALIIILLLVQYIRQARYRPVPVDGRGNPLPMMDVVDGVVTDVDRNPNYRGDMSENMLKQWMRKKLDLPLLLPPVTTERQDATTQRDQLLDLATRGGNATTNSPAKRLAGQEMARQLSTENLAGRFRVIDENSIDGLEVLDGEIIQVLDNDWEEANQK